MKRRSLAIAIALLLCGGAALAQPPRAAAPAAPAAPADAQQATRKQIVDEMVALGMGAAAHPEVPRPFQTTLGTGGRGEIVAYLIAAHSEREGYKALLQALEARALKQIGSPPANKGTTALAMKGLAPEILGLAVETGAITREIDGTTFTFRATPAGVVKALQNQGLVDMYADYADSSLQKYLSRVSLAASFDASKGPSKGSFAADSHQLTGWSVRTEIVNQRDPADYPDLWKGLLRTSEPYRTAKSAIEDQLTAWTEYLAWETQLLAATARVVETPLATDHDVKAAGGRFRALLEPALARLDKLTGMPPDALKALDAYVVQLTKLQTAIDEVYDFAAKGSLLTFDWSTTRDAALPDLYAATTVWEHALGATRNTDLTLNGVVNFYRRKPSAGVHQLKSIDFTSQLDHPLGTVLAMPKTTLTVAARFSHIPKDTVSVAPVADVSAAAPAAGKAPPASMVAPSPKGNIVVVQLKLTVPIKNSGLKVPLSITASNRTELIKEKDVRASFGITYDLDTLLGGLIHK
jgi:hypothetical protein